MNRTLWYVLLVCIPALVLYLGFYTVLRTKAIPSVEYRKHEIFDPSIKAGSYEVPKLDFINRKTGVVLNIIYSPVQKLDHLLTNNSIRFNEHLIQSYR